MRNFDEIIRTYGRDPQYDVEIIENSRRRSAKVTRISDGKVIVDISEENPRNKLSISVTPKAAGLIVLIAVAVLIYIMVVCFS